LSKINNQLGGSGNESLKAPISKPYNNKVLLSTAARFSLVALIIGYIYYSGRFNFSSALDLLADPSGYTLPIVLLVFTNYVASCRLRLLLTVHGVCLSQFRAFRIWMTGLFFSLALPGALSGDLVKGYLIMKSRQNKVELASVILLDRLLGLYMMVAVGGIMSGVMVFRSMTGLDVGMAPSLSALAVFSITLLALATLGGMALMSGRVRYSQPVTFIMRRVPFENKVNRLYEAAQTYRNHTLLLGSALGLSLISQSAAYLAIWLLAGQMGMSELGVGVFLWIISLSFIVNSIPLAPMGLGIGEAGFEALFGVAGFGGGAELAFVYHVIVIFIALTLGGSLYFLGGAHSVGFEGGAMVEPDKEKGEGYG